MKGERYLCKPDIFEATYDAIPEPKCWETDNGTFIAWGTHDHDEAEKAFENYAANVGEADIERENIDLNFDGKKYWGHPILPTLETWPAVLYSTEEIPDWEPWLVIGERP